MESAERIQDRWAMKIVFDKQAIDLTPDDKGYTAALGGKAVFVEVVQSENSQLDLLIDGQRVTAFVSLDGARRWVTVNGRTALLTKATGAKRGRAAGDLADTLSAPMPGQIRAVNVQAGETVTKGQTLLVLEAMKMEMRVQAPRDGVVKALHVKTGQTVEREQILIEIE
jgi:biotin carboxyl carrier protein